MSSETDRSTRRYQRLLYGATVLYVLNLLIRTGGFGDPAAKRFPYLFGTLTLVFAGVLLAYVLAPDRIVLPFSRAGRDGDSRIQSITETEQVDASWRMSHVVALTVAFPFLVYLFGFALGLPVWLLGFTYFLRRDLRESIAVAVGMFVLWWLLFVNFLGIIFYEGLLGLG